MLAAIAGILMLAFSLVQAPSVHAIAYKDMLPSQQAKSWAYTNAVQWCIKHAQTSSFDLSDTSNQSRITPSDAASGKWWQDSWNLQQGPEETVTSTYLHESANGDGVTTCNNVLREGAELWGYGTDFMSLMCDITGTRANGSSCRTGNGDFGSISGSDGFFRQKINDKVYGGSGVVVDNDGLYWLYYSAFMKGCQAKVTSIPAGQGNGDMIYRDIKTVDDKGALKTDTYEGVSKGEVKRVYVDPELKRHSQSCGYIADRVSEYAPALVTWHRAPANKDKVDTPATVNPGQSSQGDADGSASSCRVDGIGWIICPAINFTASIVDKAYIFVEALLVTPALNINTASPTNGTYITWSVMRNIANVAFVIAFMIIIYSQLTGVGVTNYGIKKLLPKLIVSAILVNVSYWICAIAVDLSNILGMSVTSLIDNITAKVPLPPSSVATTGGEVWGPLTATILASTTLVILGLTVLLPLLIAALAAIVTVLVVLVLRQALIVILIVVAPLAFVALLLPNTEDLFKRWRQLFQTLLLMFPIIAIIFAGSELASRTITASTYSSIGGGSAYNGNLLLQVVGAGVAIIPLFITPIVMKTAGGLLNRFAGFVNNPNKGVFDRMRKGADGIRERQEGRRAIRSLNGRPNLSFGKYRRAARRDAITSGIKAERARAEQQYIAGEIGSGDNSTAFGRKVAGGSAIGGLGADPAAIQRALANAKFTIDKAEADEVKAEALLIDGKGVGELNTILSDGKSSAAKKAAALERMVQIGKPADYESAVNQYGHDTNPDNSIIRKTLARSLGENGPQFLKASDLDAIKSGNLGSLKDANGTALRDASGKEISKTLNDIARINVGSGVYSQEKMVSDTNDNLKYAFAAAEAAGKQRLIDTANDLKANQTLRGKIKHNTEAIEEISNSSAHTQIPGQGTFF